jgi:hypothetical protein
MGLPWAANATANTGTYISILVGTYLEKEKK